MFANEGNVVAQNKNMPMDMSENGENRKHPKKLIKYKKMAKPNKKQKNNYQIGKKSNSPCK